MPLRSELKCLNFGDKGNNVKQNWLGEIYRRYYRSTISKLRKRGLSQEQSEDVINDTIMCLLSNPKLTQEGATSLFIKSAYFNGFLTARERSGLTYVPANMICELLEYKIETEVISLTTPETEMINKQSRDHLRAAIRQLPKGQKKLITDKLDGKNTTSRRYAYGLLMKSLDYDTIVGEIHY